MASLSAWKVVLIDDEEDIRDVMTIALKDAGYQVRSAPDGKEGIRLCEAMDPQIVITDIRMPVMNGIQVLESVKKLNPDIEVIVFTAFGEMDMAIQALQLDASDFITKPVNDEELHLALMRAKDRFITRKQLKDYTALLEEENVQTTQELKKTFSFQKNLIESSMDGILGCNEKGTVVTFNKSMEQMLGFSRDDVLNKMSFGQFFDPEEEKRFQEKLADEKYGGENRLFLHETALKDCSEHRIPVQVSATVLFDLNKKAGLVCFFRDLREIHRLEQEVADQARILHQDKMMSLGRLAASVVHEINNPLSGILNYIRLMIRILDRGPLKEDRREKFQQYLELIENETGRCSQIISSLLTFSRKSPLTFEKVSITNLIHRCIILSKHKLELQNIVLESHVEPNLLPVQGDFNQLQQCVINLIFNGIDSMPDGGTLTLSARYDPSTSIVTITLKDTGSGISEADLPYIFEPFFTTKKEGYGVGLGLSTVYGILERHKGAINVESRPGAGSTFQITLPVLKED